MLFMKWKTSKLKSELSWAKCDTKTILWIAQSLLDNFVFTSCVCSKCAGEAMWTRRQNAVENMGTITTWWLSYHACLLCGRFKFYPLSIINIMAQCFSNGDIDTFDGLKGLADRFSICVTDFNTRQWTFIRISGKCENIVNEILWFSDWVHNFSKC